MKFDPQKHHRRSIRVSDYDYSQPGAYFITIVSHSRLPLFGEIKYGEMHLNESGQIVWEIWNSLPERYPQIKTGAAVVMPNHFHGIVEIHESVSVGEIHQPPSRAATVVGEIHEFPLPRDNEFPLPRRIQRRRMTVPIVVGYFKMNTAKRINNILGSEGNPVWQRNYYEHIIRNEEELNRIHVYIETNINNWAKDGENPIRVK